MAIIGDSFSDYVKKQIEVRQQKLGQLQHDDDFYLWSTNRKPWIRVCSSVDINEDKLTELGLTEEFKGELLAQNYVLYGGISNINSELKGGILPNLDNSYLNTPNAYGFNSSPEFGYSPMPLVSSIQITPQNRGSLTKASLKIKCHNVNQFNIIETLYLRLKYTILIEWGHNVYYNNNGELITTPNDTIYKKFLTEKEKKFERLSEIKQERKNSCGNYDGFMGWVTNFKWSFDEHGGYDIDIEAISYGDIIESLKSNISYPNLTETELTPDKLLPGIQTVLGKTLYGFKDILTSNNKFKNGQDISSTEINTKFKLGIKKLQSTKIYSNKEIVYIQDPNLKSLSDPYYYIKLGTLFRIIQDLVYLKDNEGNSLSTFNFDYTNNFCFNPGNCLLSLDSRVCIVPSQIKSPFWDWESLGIDTSFLYKDDLGRVMNIYLNIDFVLNCLNKNLNTESNTLSVYDFITSILNGINNACGNVNALKITFDAEENQFSILDENIPPSKSEPTKFNIIKLANGNGSFVKKSSLNSQLSPEFATQIAIGAQASSTSTNNSILAFSNWNKGLTDRIIPSKEQSSNNPKTESSFKKDFDTLTDTLSNFYFEKNKLASNKNLYNRVIESISPKKVFSSFIPIDLSLEMEGLSGMKLFQKYSIIDKYLPKNYRNNIEFILKGITHSVNEKEWNTTINGLSIPKPTIVPSDFSTSLPQSTPQSRNTETTATPNADALRSVLDTLGYAEKGEEISNGGDITSQLADYAIAVFTEIKTQIPNAKIIVTGGNDLYHQSLSYTSSHKKGDGLDFIITPNNPTTLSKVDLILQGFAAGNRNPSVSFINEYEDPTKASTGKHFHIRIGRDKSGFDKIENAYTLADKGLLATYSIT